MSLALIPRPSEAESRAKRIDALAGTIVESKTLGTDFSFHLEAANASRTGLLVNTGRYKRIPFGPRTLVELKIDPDKRYLDEPVKCLGKIVRREGEDRYGIEFVDMEKEDARRWESFLAHWEATLSGRRMGEG